MARLATALVTAPFKGRGDQTHLYFDNPFVAQTTNVSDPIQWRPVYRSPEFDLSLAQVGHHVW